KGFIKIVPNEDRTGGVWTLSKNGFDAIRWTLPEKLKEEGFASEHIKHDLLVLSAHLGDWILGLPNNVQLVTEQVLRRVLDDQLPNCISVSGHRPDGYWIIQTTDPKNPRVIALEVERSTKKPDDYRLAGDFYAERKEIESIIWIIQ